MVKLHLLKTCDKTNYNFLKTALLHICFNAWFMEIKRMLFPFLSYIFTNCIWYQYILRKCHEEEYSKQAKISHLFFMYDIFVFGVTLFGFQGSWEGIKCTSCSYGYALEHTQIYHIMSWYGTSLNSKCPNLNTL